MNRIKITLHNKATGKTAYFYATPQDPCVVEHDAGAPDCVASLRAYQRAWVAVSAREEPCDFAQGGTIIVVSKPSDAALYADEYGTIHTDKGVCINAAAGFSKVFVYLNGRYDDWERYQKAA